MDESVRMADLGLARLQRYAPCPYRHAKALRAGDLELPATPVSPGTPDVRS